MTAITLYHNPRCSKSRQALELLRGAGVEPELRLYLETPPDSAELTALLGRLGIAPRELLRSGEPAFKEANLKDPAIDDATLIAAMVAHPKLIERPIAVSAERAVVGRPPESVLELLA
jgi:arsenate reductase